MLLTSLGLFYLLAGKQFQGNDKTGDKIIFSCLNTELRLAHCRFSLADYFPCELIQQLSLSGFMSLRNCWIDVKSQRLKSRSRHNNNLEINDSDRLSSSFQIWKINERRNANRFKTHLDTKGEFQWMITAKSDVTLNYFSSANGFGRRRPLGVLIFPSAFVVLVSVHGSFHDNPGEVLWKFGAIIKCAASHECGAAGW